MARERRQTVEFLSSDLKFLDWAMWLIETHFGPRNEKYEQAFEQDDAIAHEAQQIRTKVQDFIKGKGK